MIQMFEFRYEISNFGRPGFECNHNIGYWNGGQYIGLGAYNISLLKLSPSTLMYKYDLNNIFSKFFFKHFRQFELSTQLCTIILFICCN